MPPSAPHGVPTPCLPFTPPSQRSFKNFPSREPMRRMHKQEGKAELSLDRLQLEALHKVRQPPSPPSPAPCAISRVWDPPDTPPFFQVRFSPNLEACGWLVSGGQAGIVRLHCLAGLAAAVDPQLLPQSRARYSSHPGPPVSPPSE